MVWRREASQMRDSVVVLIFILLFIYLFVVVDVVLNESEMVSNK